MPLSSRLGGVAREYGGAVEETTAVRPRPVPALAIDPEIQELLGRIVAAVAGQEDGLTAVELRAQLSERPDRLQRALAAGLRARKIRRSGSRCQTRYIRNA